MSGQYQPLDGSLYSADVVQLVKSMLQTDAALRPSINQLLRFPILQQYIRQTLDDEVFAAEFSHTVLHQQQVFMRASTCNPLPSGPAQDEQQAEEPAEAGDQIGNALEADAKVPSYGYKPWKIPKNAEAPAKKMSSLGQHDQDIDPIGAANNVLQKI